MRIRDMPVSKAQIDASNRYNAKNCVNVALRFNKKTDADVIEKLNTIDESKQGYIKRLIREDIERQKEKE